MVIAQNEAVHHRIEGEGAPLLLLHAFGLSSHVWSPVLPWLIRRRQVLLVDLPGHGRSPMPPPGIAPDPAGYARVLAGLLDRLGVDMVDIAGNSIGGWTALELAKIGRARSVVALSPAGLWPGEEPAVRRIRFRVEHAAARATLPLLNLAVGTAAGRAPLLGEAMTSARSLPSADARELIGAYAHTKDMGAHLRARQGQRFTGGATLTIPVTVAWGEQDRFIPTGARSKDQLPSHTRWLQLPGCGHVMMWDNAELVADTIVAGTSAPPPQ